MIHATIERPDIPLSDRQVWLTALGWFTLSRVVVLAVGFVGVATFIDHHSLAIEGPVALDPVSVWRKWDVLWYERIAVNGYAWQLDTPQGQATAAFFPLYPVTIGLLLTLVPGGSFFWLGSLVSAACTLAAAVLVVRMAATSVPQAWRLMLVLFSAAGSFYLSLPYAEALFLLLVTGAMLATRRRLYLWAGLAAGLAAVTRPQGLALVAVPLVACWLDIHLSTRERLVRLAAIVALVLVPLAIYVGAMADLQGSAGAMIERQALWSNATPYPLRSLVGLVDYPRRVQAWLHGACWLLAVALLVRYRRRLPPGAVVFTAGALLISTQHASFHGIYRYTAVLVPLVIGLADDYARVRATVVAINVIVGVIMILAFVTNNRLAV